MELLFAIVHRVTTVKNRWRWMVKIMFSGACVLLVGQRTINHLPLLTQLCLLHAYTTHAVPSGQTVVTGIEL